MFVCLTIKSMQVKWKCILSVPSYCIIGYGVYLLLCLMIFLNFWANSDFSRL